jgi:hypothetical protein
MTNKKSAEVATITKEQYVSVITNSGITDITELTDEQRAKIAAAALAVDNNQLQKVGGGSYLEFQNGDTVLLLVSGVSVSEMVDQNTGELKQVEVVDCENFETKEAHICGQTVLVGSIKKQISAGVQFPKLVKVHCKGKKAGKKYLDLDVFMY